MLSLVAEFTVSNTFVVIAILAICVQSIFLLVALFGRGPRYRVSAPDLRAMSEEDFLRTLEAVTDARMTCKNRSDVLPNGENFYPAELDAIRQARRTICLEAYIFSMGTVARQFIHALAERARAGVKVKVVLDGVGSAAADEDDFRELLEAGGCVTWYHSLRFHNIPSYNNRTHRELLIIDGETAFIGGAGIADHWMISTEGKRRWRDTVVQVNGEAVTNLQATFAENWLEASGEILAGPEYFPDCEGEGTADALVVNSTPSAGGSTRGRILIQMMIAYAKRTVHITTPYFLPDRSISHEIERAVRRGVEVKILTPGKHNDHLLTRSSSRRAYGSLLKAGARIFEYRPGMLHAKVLIVDGHWAIVGSTNFDNRSFGLNDEVNMAACNREFAETLESDFRMDLTESSEMTYQLWERRPIFERVPELLGWVLERQQ